MSAELAIGLVGCGRLAQAGYVPALRAAHGVRLAAVADPDPTRRARAAGGVASFESAAALLEQGAVDALVLATPVTSHLADARVAAAAGVPVLVEKPPAQDADTAAELLALDPQPWIAFNRRFGAGQRAVRAAIPAQSELDLRLELLYRRRSWGAHTVGDEVLLDLAPHLVDLARWLSDGEVTGVRNAAVTHQRARFALELQHGRAQVTCAADRAHRERVEARDASGRVMASHNEGGLVTGVRARLAGGHRPHPLVASLTAQLEAFAIAISGGEGHGLATAADGHAVMAVVDAVRASAGQAGRQITVAVAA
ncbi:MAG: Gfo/Idh/MocA family oxidoreductase [Solirubrobacteraceae bacterium MAG38_C4-C5]|nr:Gfo/Idh/MocA family oxidoreductase [Candidatus Siliceabacter maunaloa]